VAPDEPGDAGDQHSHPLRLLEKVRAFAQLG